MDLSQSLSVLAALNGVRKDERDPFKNMPSEVENIVLMHYGKRVNIEETVRRFFNNPSFICTDVKKFWRYVMSDSRGYVIDVAREFRTEIVYR